METVFQPFFDYLTQLGFFRIVLPFVLIFVMLFTILRRTPIFEGIRNHHKICAMIAFVISFISVASAQIMQMVSSLAIWAAGALLMIVGLMVILNMIGHPLHSRWDWGPLWLVILLAGIGFASAWIDVTYLATGLLCLVIFDLLDIKLGRYHNEIWIIFFIVLGIASVTGYQVNTELLWPAIVMFAVFAVIASFIAGKPHETGAGAMTDEGPPQRPAQSQAPAQDLTPEQQQAKLRQLVDLIIRQKASGKSDQELIEGLVAAGNTEQEAQSIVDLANQVIQGGIQ